jgi:diguanylate cyclase (GGDEF)-like protein
VNLGTPRPPRSTPEDHLIRRTWWLLSAAFVVLALITGFRALTSGAVADWIPVVGVAIAAVAAIVNRNAVAILEARGRAETDNFARILQGLSRSVSVDAIVGAIVDDLAEGTGADHVVIARRRPEGGALEATLVTRRPGVPSSSTVLPIMDLESPLDREPPPAIPVPMDVGMPDRDRERERELVPAGPGPRPASRPQAGDGLPARLADPSEGLAGPSAGLAGPHARRRAPWRGSAGGGVVAVGMVRRVVDRGTAGLTGFLGGLGVSSSFLRAAPLLSPRSEVLGAGSAARVAARIAERVRSVYGLSHTLAAALETETGVIGAVVLSRRDREDWPDAARRLLESAAVEASAALARAYSYREVATHASTDPLTGLPNRRYFDEFCGLLARRRRSGDAVAVLMVDIDRFKVLNDTYGHPVGDEVLKAVAGAIVTAVREEDVPARVGGEEFAVLLRNPGPDVALEVGERVRQAVRDLDLRRHGVPGVSVSVGVANGRVADEPIPEIVERADQALLRAKRAGRDRVIAA